MRSIEEAWIAIEQVVQPLAPRIFPLESVLGLRLAQPVVSPTDVPPFPKALMDGYAVRSCDVKSGQAVFAVLEMIVAGTVPRRPITLGTASQVMTGAPLPSGADAVIPVENAIREGDTVRLNSRPVHPGANMMRQGESAAAGSSVLTAGTLLGPVQLGALAELGVANVAVVPRPQVAVLATGDELVSYSKTPGPGQIRNSNEAMLTAQLRQSGVEVQSLGIAADHLDSLREHIKQGLNSHILILSGGVSAGVLDLVPQALAAEGVNEVFHKIDMKPGKPLWFGVRPESGYRPACFVFGLPGNPISSLVCCELFVRTALRRLQNHPQPRPVTQSARLKTSFIQNGSRPVFHPARIEREYGGQLVAGLVPWHGSADLCGTAAANGMVYFPTGNLRYDIDAVVQAYPWTDDIPQQLGNN